MENADEILTGRDADGNPTDVGKHTGLSGKADAPDDSLTAEADRRAAKKDPSPSSADAVIEDADRQ